MTIAESGAGVRYLVERYGNGQLAPAPHDWVARAAFDEWLQFYDWSSMEMLF